MIARFLARHFRSPRQALATEHPPHIRVAECLHALESRYMFDAAGVATGAEAAVDAFAQEQAEQAVDKHLDDSGAADAWQASDASPADSAEANDQLLEALATHQPPAGQREIVFVDTSVEDYQTLIAGIDPSAEVVLLDATRDGVEQIAEVLAGRSGIDAIHIVSHGSQAELQLGTARLTLDSMAGRYADELAAIGQALTDEGDILMYGCNLAEGGQGQEAAAKLAAKTGADVAASEDLSGHAKLGGDWDLEFCAGAIEATVALSEQAQAQWDGLLATVAVDTTNDVRDGDTSSIANLLANKGADGNISLREAVIATNNTAGADTIILASGTYMLSIGGSTEELAATGDLDIRDTLTLNGAGAASTIIDANGVDRVLDVRAAGTLYLTGITLTDGSAGLDGGGLNVQSGGTATVTASIISANSAGTSGGGIYNQGTLTLDQVRITGNDAGTSGGGIYNQGTLTLDQVRIDGNNAGLAGGGIYNDGVATLTRSLIDNNDAGTDGGGIRNTGVNLDLTNVTISGNTAATDGGGLSSSGPATLQNVTISANSAAVSGGGIDVSGGTTSLKNTIVANNTAFPGPDVNGTISSQGFNIVRNRAGSSGWIATDLPNGTDPSLGALADNGGFTPTHALAAASPAIDGGTSTGAPADDQRGYLRNVGAIDIGAYEYNAAANQAPQSNDVSASGSEDAASIAITLSGSDGDGTVASFRLAGLPANGTLYTDAGLTTLANISTDYPASGNALTLYFVPGADWNGTTSFTYAATDNLGLADATAGTATITVTAVNDAPVNTVPASIPVTEDVASALTGISIADVDAASGTVLVTFSVPSGTLAAISGGGVTVGGSGSATLTMTGTVANINAFIAASNVTFTSALNATAPVTLTVTTDDQGNSGSGGAQSDSDPVTLTVTAVNDAPVITSNGGGATASVSAAENQTAVTTVTSGDVDGGAAAYSIVGGADAALFGVNTATGVLSFNTAPNFEAPTDAGTNNVYDVTVQVSDGNGGSNTQAIAVTVTNVNELPMVNDQAFSMAENSANGTLVGTLAATDPDVSATLSYSITAGNTGGAFTINTATGQITVANAAVLDFETNPTLTLTVQVQDAGGLTDTITVTVTLADVNEAPASDDQPSNHRPSTQGPDRQGGERRLSREDEANRLTASSVAGAPTTIRQPIEGLARSSDRLMGIPRDAIERLRHPLIAAQKFLSPRVPDQDARAARRIDDGIRASDKLWAAIDRMKAEMDSDQGQLNDKLVAVTGAGVVLSVGFVAWLLRGGSLLAALLSTMPVWKGLDPLPILVCRRTKEDEKRRRQPAQEDASIEGLFSSPPGGQLQ